MLARRLPGDDDVVEVREAALSVESPQDHVGGPLEGLRGVRQPKREALIAVSSLVANANRLVASLGGHKYLPIPRVAVQR